ncbi:MAG TPA: sulfite exporter TauE/SafE family protein [Thermodesulfobacteriota bacterium]|nr:sulfite exporter TauE/SafE family protein [Thermodesulfobacteriota bacterium]
MSENKESKVLRAGHSSFLIRCVSYHFKERIEGYLLPPCGGGLRWGVREKGREIAHFGLNFFILLFLGLFLFYPHQAYAHPMGNFSINHYSKIEVDKNGLKLRYIIDLAEIPTFQELGEIDTNGDKITSPEEEKAYLSRKVEELKNGISLKLNEEPINLKPESVDMIFIPGAGGLPTIKITVEYSGEFGQAELSELNTARYVDNNYSGRTGWKEIIVLGKDGVTIANSSAPSSDISNELASYPEDALSSLPQDVQAAFSFSLEDGQMGIASTDNREVDTGTGVAKTPKDSFAELVTNKKLTPQIILLSLVIAFGLGAFHALSPGHGKTVVAAYLVGSRGTAGHALLLGAVVTLTHTIGVFALGFVTLFASKYILPEKLYPWLGFTSGLIILVMGMFLFSKRYRALFSRKGAHVHGHPHSHQHQHSHSHDHEHGHHHHEIPERVTWGGLFALGVSGGIIPCPEALIVLLSAISLQRVGFGLVLILAFSIGLALVLMAIGLMMVYARRFMERFNDQERLMRTLPLISSIVISILGFAIAVQSLVGGEILQISFKNINLSPTLIATLGLGFIFGLKHALDADHIVAVSTIVSEYKSISKSSLIGTFWGLGHTASLLLVGLVVILLRLTIPAKLALLMEFGVAVMLVLLGMNIIWKVFHGTRVHVHTHEHHGITHSHLHVHEGRKEEHKHNHLISLGKKPFLVGLVHGVAGSAALMLLVLATVPTPLAGLIYILIFGIGSVGGMLIMSSLIGLPFVLTASRLVPLNERIKAVAGVLSVAFGIFLGWEIGIVEGLFL